jgi:fructokinase
LVAELMALAHAVKLNEDEATEIDRIFDGSHANLAEFTKDWSEKLRLRALAVTRGAHGCAIRIGQDYAEVPGYAVTVADTVGSGDAFAAAFLHGLAQGWDSARTGEFANRVGAVVASRHGGVPLWTIEDCWNLK